MILSEDHRLIRDAVRAFVAAEIVPHAAAWDRDSTFPRAALRGLGELGVLGITVPSEWQGAGLDYLTLALVIEEIGFGDAATSTIVSVQNSLPCGILNTQGSPAQKQQWLRGLASGELLGCFCLTEPHAGSDASNLRTRARRDGDDWVLNGTKHYITSGQNADVAIVIAVTDAAQGKRGMSAFLVPTATPGYVVARVEKKLGQRASDTAQISLEDCRVPGHALIGETGMGYRIALGSLESGRIGIAAQCLGIARAALEAAIDYASQREAFGVPIIEHQGVSFRLADMATRLEAARQLVWHAAALKDAGELCLAAASMAKLFASEMVEFVTSAAIQVHGGCGTTDETIVERLYRDARVTQIYEGASDIQRLLIGRELAAAWPA